MKLISILISIISFTLYCKETKGEGVKQDELKLRNQLFSDVFLIREGVDRLNIEVEVLNKRQNNQMEILKGIQSELITKDFEEEDDVCVKVSSMFNATLRKATILENKVVTKLEEMQNDQAIRLDEIILKQNLNKNCGSSVSSASLTVMANTLSEISEKIDKLEEKILKLEALEKKQSFDKFVESHLKMLEEINQKLSKNQEQFEKISKGVENLKDLNNNVNRVITSPHPKLPMEVILGLTSSNLTKLS